MKLKRLALGGDDPVNLLGKSSVVELIHPHCLRGRLPEPIAPDAEGWAEFLLVLDLAHAHPAFLQAVTPVGLCHALHVIVAAAAADNLAGKAAWLHDPVHCGIVLTGFMDFVPHRLPGLAGDDRLMIVFYIIGRELTFVALAVMIERIRREVFLQNHIALVHLVLKHVGDADVGQARKAILIGPALGPLDRHPGEEVIKDPAHHRSLVFLHDEGFTVPPVSEGGCVPLFTALEFLLHRPLDIGGNRLALFFGEACEDGKHELSVSRQGINVFLLEAHSNPERFQVTDDVQQVHCVAGKPADRLGEHDVYAATFTIIEQALQFCAFCRPGAGNEAVGVNAHILPFRIALDQLTVVADLG